MIKIEATINSVDQRVDVEIKGDHKDATLLEAITADLVMDKINSVRGMSSIASKVYSQRVKTSPRPSHADWVDEALAEIEKAEKEVGNAGSN